MEIEIEKAGNDSYRIKLNQAMVGIVSREELLKICEKIQREAGDYTYE